MAEALQACCEKARRQYVARVVKGIVSYPVIKSIPCPTCRRVIPIRLYTPPREAGESV